ncbi:phenylacetate--CoA ligase family protein [Microbacterium sp. YJN-G]|uniref:phenylacetate--CoA ligase family protein n=1 Tax=Microbacterium sp. YJN-G TaxID=2763257 RepID=UPI001878D03A|nr:AMP-binding protein [Microbacterium sp. YJN-G]
MDVRRSVFDFKVAAVGGSAYRSFLARSRLADRSGREALLQQQRADAAELARWASVKSVWYRERIAPLLADDLADPQTFERIPILEKEDLRDHYDEIIAVDSGVRRTTVARTGGSTGQPLKVLKDFSVRPATLTWRLMHWWGVDPSDNSASVERLPWHGIKQVANTVFWWPTKKVNVDAGAMDESDLAYFARAIRRIEPTMIWGYAHSLHEFALAVERNGWQLPSPRAISSSAAPLTATQAADIERILGAPVYETYRAAEVSLIAGQCEHRRGLHVQADHKLLEVVDDDGRRVPDGEPGEIVVTDLLNHAQPILRYRLGDVGVIDTEPCPCGRPFPLLNALLGRSNDVIRTKEGLVSIYSFASAFSKHPAIQQYQIHQLEDYSLLLKVVPSGPAVMIEDLGGALADLSREFRGALPVSAELVERLPHIRGKQKSVVSHLSDAQGTGDPQGTG